MSFSRPVALLAAVAAFTAVTLGTASPASADDTGTNYFSIAKSGDQSCVVLLTGPWGPGFNPGLAMEYWRELGCGAPTEVRGGRF